MNPDMLSINLGFLTLIYYHGKLHVEALRQFFCIYKKDRQQPYLNSDNTQHYGRHVATLVSESSSKCNCLPKCKTELHYIKCAQTFAEEGNKTYTDGDLEKIGVGTSHLANELHVWPKDNYIN